MTNNAIDELNKLLSQAEATLDLLTTDGQSRDGFQSSHNTITDAIWLVLDLVSKAHQEVRNIL